jgi:hypothetical protein
MIAVFSLAYAILCFVNWLLAGTIQARRIVEESKVQKLRCPIRTILRLGLNVLLNLFAEVLPEALKTPNIKTVKFHEAKVMWYVAHCSTTRYLPSHAGFLAGLI